jgi:hypothetical protein
MKKAFFLLTCILALTVVSCEKQIVYDKLPQKAKLFLSNYFPDSQVLSIEKNGHSYDVILTDGTDLEFNKSGEWTEVDCQTRPVPVGIAPAAIQSYVMTNFPEAFIVKIKIERKNYEVELNNDIELTFDKNGMLLYAED